jgi:hypothetical protein
MCSPATCPACKKTTWSGCGEHANQVMAGVPKNQRCACTPVERAASKGFLDRLLGR